jgi:transcription-repair coupling factor (superfamily II helicase)
MRWKSRRLSFGKRVLKKARLQKAFPVPYIPWSELNDNLSEFAYLELGHSTEAEDELQLAAHFGHDERFGGRLKPFIDYLAPIVDDSEQVYIVSRQAQRLRELWFEHYRDSEHPNLEFIESSLSEGFTLITKADSRFTLHLITDSEVFGWERPQPRTRQRQTADTPEALYADLQVGDYVVHVDHGIGRFAGLIQRQLDGHEREYLTVEYDTRRYPLCSCPSSRSADALRRRGWW